MSIPSEMFEEMVAQARAEAPLEACGILAGRAQQAEQLYTMNNIDQSAEHFMMDPREQFAVVKDMRARGLHMLAIYHSHPASPARPSDEDVRLALTPEVLYVILSLQNASRPDIKAYRINDGVVTESSVTVTGTCK